MSAAGPADFLKAQRLAFAACEHARARLQDGMNEVQASKLMRDYLQGREDCSFFHLPFAWFGERTCFKDFKRPFSLSLAGGLPHFGRDFMPKESSRLRPGMAVILDVAPVVNGVFADVGYSYFHGPMPRAYREALEVLIRARDLIPTLVGQGLSIGEIYERVENLFAGHGLENRHALYPLGVLGHRVGDLPDTSLPLPKSLPQIHVRGFPLKSIAYFLKKELPLAPAGKNTPFLRQGVDHPPEDGTWAIEPHLGGPDWGAKFEEILVIEGGKARWLDPTPPAFLLEGQHP